MVTCNEISLAALHEYLNLHSIPNVSWTDNPVSTEEYIEREPKIDIQEGS